MAFFSARVSIRKILFTVVFAYAALLAVLFFSQRDLLYYPFGEYAPPQQAGLENTQEMRFATADGTQSLAWFSPPPEDSSGKVVVFFHGNGGSIGHNVGLLTRLQHERFGFLAMEYRGYPGYAGDTTEQNLYIDARAAMEFLQEQGYRGEDIILLGQSLGSGIAVQMAVEYDVALLALLSPFTAIADAAAEIYWYVPVQYLVLDRFDSYSKIADVSAPIYIFHGSDDTLVPIALGKRLYDRATAQKRFFEQEGKGHNNLDLTRVIRRIAEFTDAQRITIIPEEEPAADAVDDPA